MSDSNAASPSPFPELLPPNTQSTILPTPVPTPSHGTGGSFSLACSTTVSATPAACLAAVLKPTTWPQWNTFCRRATITNFPSPPPPIPVSLPGLESSVEAKEALVPSTQVSFDVHMNLDAKLTNRQSIVVTRVEELKDSNLGDVKRKGFRVAWRAEGIPSFLLRAERVQDFVEVEGEGGVACEYFCWETFYGLLAPVLRLSVGSKLVVAFNAAMGGLKKFVEDGAVEGAAK